MSEIKQLAWEHVTNALQYRVADCWTATTPFWDYKIKTTPDGKYVAWNQDGEIFDTLEEAQQWFQTEVWEPSVRDCLTKGDDREIS